MSLNWKIAARYLRSKKSHGAVSAIAAVSLAGVAIATAAVVCVLSVFNGFKEVLTEKYDILAPDITVSAVEGKVFEGADSVAAVLRSLPGVEHAMPTVADKALAVFQGREYPVTVKGVSAADYSQITKIDSVILSGGRMPVDYYEEIPQFEYIEDYEEYIANTPKPEVLMSIGAAARLGNVVEGDRLMIFAPKREGRYNPANPAASFMVDSVAAVGVYQSHQKDYDEDMVIVPIGLARHLFQYDDQASSIELRVKAGYDVDKVKAEVAKVAGPRMRVRDRAEEQQVNFRMVNIEKWVSFLLLFFILIIATFNIISTMTMLVLEKRRSMAVLNSLGMSRGRIARIFADESMLVSLIGGAAGVALGFILCILQEKYGLIRLHGNPETLIIRYYPVKVIWSDLALAFAPSVILGAVTSWIAGAFARSRVTSNPAAATGSVS